MAQSQCLHTTGNQNKPSPRPRPTHERLCHWGVESAASCDEYCPACTKQGKREFVLVRYGAVAFYWSRQINDWIGAKELDLPCRHGHQLHFVDGELCEKVPRG